MYKELWPGSQKDKEEKPALRAHFLMIGPDIKFLCSLFFFLCVRAKSIKKLYARIRWTGTGPQRRLNPGRCFLSLYNLCGLDDVFVSATRQFLLPHIV